VLQICDSAQEYSDTLDCIEVIHLLLCNKSTFYVKHRVNVYPSKTVQCTVKELLGWCMVYEDRSVKQDIGKLKQLCPSLRSECWGVYGCGM
jgi:hypothetical protein